MEPCLNRYGDPKKRWATKAAAIFAAAWERDVNGRNAFPYACKICKKWHVSQHPPTEQVGVQ